MADADHRHGGRRCRGAVLRIPLNAPIAKVDRIAVDRSGIILYAGHGIYRGDAISMEIELR